MKPNNSILTGILIISIFLSWIFFNQKLNLLENKLNAAVDRISYFPPNPNKDGRDPYIDGAVKNTIRKHFLDIQGPYIEYLKGDTEKTDGKIEIDWQIDVSGKVISPEIIFSDFKDGKLEKGILDAISSWKFPPPPYGRHAYVAHKFYLKKE